MATIARGSNEKALVHGVGVDNIDVDAATSRGIPVVVAAGANAVSVAEHTIALLLAVTKQIVSLDASIRAGRWARHGKPCPDGAGLSAARRLLPADRRRVRGRLPALRAAAHGIESMRLRPLLIITVAIIGFAYAADLLGFVLASLRAGDPELEPAAGWCSTRSAAAARRRPRRSAPGAPRGWRRRTERAGAPVETDPRECSEAGSLAVDRLRCPKGGTGELGGGRSERVLAHPRD
jgi:hypothetical protein